MPGLVGFHLFFCALFLHHLIAISRTNPGGLPSGIEVRPDLDPFINVIDLVRLEHGETEVESMYT